MPINFLWKHFRNGVHIFVRQITLMVDHNGKLWLIDNMHPHFSYALIFITRKEWYTQEGKYVKSLYGISLNIFKQNPFFMNI